MTAGVTDEAVGAMLKALSHHPSIGEGACRTALTAALPHLVEEALAELEKQEQYVEAYSEVLAKRDARIRALEEALTSATKALRPLTKGVFNDNGDISVSFSSPSYEDSIAAYFAERKARAALDPSP